jgi:hypothetical protein
MGGLMRVGRARGEIIAAPSPAGPLPAPTDTHSRPPPITRKTKHQFEASTSFPPPLNPQGARLHSREPWRKAGDNDGSTWMRPMTEEELKWQDENC